MARAPETRPSLLVRLRDRSDGPAWRQFVEVYAPLIYGVARRQGLQDADAADVTQETLRIVSQAIRRLEYDARRGSFRGWLFTIVRNELRDWHSRQGRAPQAAGDSATLRLLHDKPAPEEESAWVEAYRDRLFRWAAPQVESAVEPATWQAFWRTSVVGEPVKVVARDLKLSVAAVYMARSRVLSRLRELVQQVEEDSHG